jgi:hypothetical protein
MLWVTVLLRQMMKISNYYDVLSLLTTCVIAGCFCMSIFFLRRKRLASSVLLMVSVVAGEFLLPASITRHLEISGFNLRIRVSTAYSDSCATSNGVSPSDENHLRYCESIGVLDDFGKGVDAVVFDPRDLLSDPRECDRLQDRLPKSGKFPWIGIFVVNKFECHKISGLYFLIDKTN